MCIYQLGRLRRLILFVDYPPMYINWAVSDDRYFSLIWTTLRSYLVLDNPPKPFSLDLSHALTPTVLGCPSAYGMHDVNSITVYVTCKYINMHIFT